MTDDPAPLDAPLGRACRRVRDALDHVDGRSPAAWRNRRHVGRCEGCAEAWAAHQLVAEGLTDVVATPAAIGDEPEVAPPEGLLEDLLSQAAEGGLRSRAAVPMRGAVSGARPGLTVAFVGLAALVGALAAYATWRLTRVFRQPG